MTQPRIEPKDDHYKDAGDVMPNDRPEIKYVSRLGRGMNQARRDDLKVLIIAWAIGFISLALLLWSVFG